MSTIRISSVLAALLFASGQTAACAAPRPPTELVLVVDTDMEAPAELDEVSVVVTAPNGSEFTSTRQAVTATSFPLTLGVRYAGNGPLSPVSVSVTAFSRGAELLQSRSRTSFMRERSLLWQVSLVRSCVAAECADRTCGPGGCTVVDVDPASLPPFSGTVPRIGRDAGTATVVDAGGQPPDASREHSGDAGPPRPGETCDAVDVPVFSTSVSLSIDTTRLSNDATASSCAHPAVGNDGYVAFEAHHGEIWDVQLEGQSLRDPVLTLGPEGDCAPRSCASALYRDACATEHAEHLALNIPSDGRWIAGIDDTAPGGGAYVLKISRLVCGDGRRVSGEGCEDGNRVDDDACDNACRATIGTDAAGETRSAEIEPNDTPYQANRLLFTPGAPVEISGDIGGTDCYPDDIAVVLTGDASTRWRLQVRNADPTCATAPPYTLRLIDESGVEAGGGRDARNCAEIDVSDLRPGTWLVRMTPSPGSGTSTFSRYRLTFLVTPG